jgi:hypothetical protein
MVALPLMPSAPAARRSDLFDAGAVLGDVLASLRGPGDVAVFDLDSTVLDNRPRQARIVREYALYAGEPRLGESRPEHFVDWHWRTPLASCGLEDREIALHAEPFQRFWAERFYTSEYARDDVPIPGASGFLSAVAATGATIAYVTGRPGPMGPGTFDAFVRAAFPLPDGRSVHALMKPDAALDDDLWKLRARDLLRELGEVRCAFDNEPTHVNSYRAGFPVCHAVHLDTDHSGRPVEIHRDIPSIRDFTAPLRARA